MENEEKIVCCNCGTELEDNNEQFEYEGDIYCDECYHEQFFYCEECNEVCPTDEECYCEHCGRFCESCYSDHHIQCSDCNRTICLDNDRYITVDGNHVCERCEENYSYCDGCDEWFNSDYITYCEEDERYYCNACYPENKHGIHDYSYKPSPVFYGKGKLYLGVELEAENKSNSYLEDITEHLDSLNNDRFYLKQDGSLSNGFEIVTHPCSLEYHQTKFPWSDITRYLISKGFRSHDTSTCGLHVHASKQYLTNTEQIKLGIFVNLQIGKMEKLGRRSNNSYAKFKDLKISGKLTAHKNTEGRYEAVNWLNEKTVEFRFPKGTLNHNTLLATIELVDSLLNFVKICSTPALVDTDKSWKLYCDFIRDRDRYKRLMEYMQIKNVFCDTMQGVLLCA